MSGTPAFPSALTRHGFLRLLLRLQGRRGHGRLGGRGLTGLSWQASPGLGLHAWDSEGATALGFGGYTPLFGFKQTLGQDAEQEESLSLQGGWAASWGPSSVQPPPPTHTAGGATSAPIHRPRLHASSRLPWG